MEANKTATPWTHFMDMHSGGGCKESPYEHIYIEAPLDVAVVVFYNRFKHNPYRVTCTCCGEDYSVSEARDLAQASGYERGCDSGYQLEDGSIVDNDYWQSAPLSRRRELNGMHGYVERQSTRFSFHKYCTLDEYIKRPDVLVIRASEITPDERKGEPPTQGYVWVD